MNNPFGKLTELLSGAWGRTKSAPEFPYQPTFYDPVAAAVQIVKWDWDRYKKTGNPASPEDLIECLEDHGYKATNQLTDEERETLTPKRRIICDAVEDIARQGSLSGKTGQALRDMSEGKRDHAGLHI